MDEWKMEQWILINNVLDIISAITATNINERQHWRISLNRNFVEQFFLTLVRGVHRKVTHI